MGNPPIYLNRMATNSTLLCIHRDPAQLSLLQDNGYDLVTAANGHEGLRLFMSRPVDAIVLEYYLGLLDGAIIADEIKHVRPDVPIVMLADHLELPNGALKSVDALVTKADEAHFLLATIHFVLNAGLDERRKGTLKAQTLAHVRRPVRSREGEALRQVHPSRLATDGKGVPFSPSEWKNIWNGTIQF